MGKRQIGELQPSELVITILISEVAAIPIQDNSLPLITAIIPVLVLICLEIILSVLSMKSIAIRNAFSGKSVTVIENGKINKKKMKSLRFTTDDLIAALRQQDVFDINEVDTAIVETNGSLSVLKKAGYQTVTAEMLAIPTREQGVPQVLISDGEIIKDNIGVYGISHSDIEEHLSKNDLKIQDVFLMTVNRLKEFNVVKTEKGN
ncbi:MAG: DUF421 domain-containing protein [Clostridia bacterium]|nr:DUF421 domain-containing protein [Clostridia bacterium]